MISLKKLFRVFLVILIGLLNSTCFSTVYADDEKSILNNEETILSVSESNIQSASDSFELLDKTFTGTSNGSLIVKFYSKQYNSVQDTCMEVNDRGHVTYIYFSYNMYNNNTCTLELYTSAVKGYWSQYAPLQIKCVWNGEKLSVTISMINGMALVSSIDCELVGGVVPPVKPTDPSDNDKAELILNPVNCIVGKTGYLEGTYIPKSPSNISNELNSIKWTIKNSSISEFKNFSYIIASDKKSATLKIEIVGKKCGETDITGDLSSIGEESKTTHISVEPELILPVSNASFVNDYDCNIYISGEDYICVKVSMEEADREYLEKFLSNIKYEITKNPDSSNENIAEITNTGYIISNDNKTGEFIMDIDPRTTSLDNIVIINTSAQSKSIRVIYDSPYTDADQDGIPDKWEENGLDTDKDGIIDVDLKAMGAVAGQKDLFVEIDKMDKLNISQKSLNMVAEQFKKHNINLHIDAGPNSIDYVTGKKWGSLSRSDIIPYEKLTTLGETAIDENGNEYYKNFDGWDELSNKYFTNERRAIFRHCMLINSFDTKGTSGIARGIPEQSFIITSSGFGNDNNNDERAIAGTFMHELGHTLGLRHGGSDDTNYKPNDLSIMNYLYQFSGLCGTNEINYSEYALPELDENSIDETKGIDPQGVIADKQLGVKWLLKKDHSVNIDNPFYRFQSNSVSGNKIDFNKDGKFEPLVKINFWNGDDDNENKDEGIENGAKITINTASINEWNILVFAGGSIGNLGASSPLSKIVTDKNEVIIENISVDKAKELGIYENNYDERCSHNITKVDRTEPTCTKSGNIKYFICNDCHKIFNDENCHTEITKLETLILALGHDYGKWKVTREPTCTEDGIQERTCNMCGKKETKSSQALGHDYGEWEVIKGSTDKEEGYKERTCMACGEKDVAVIDKINATLSQSSDKNENDKTIEFSTKNDKASKVITGDTSNIQDYILYVMTSIVIIIILCCLKKKNS